MEATELNKVEVDLLLEGIYRVYGFDFRNYAFSSIQRRIHHRMNVEKLSTITGLLDKVLHCPGMMENVLSDFSVNVTEMFRDPGFFLAFRTRIIPLLNELPYIRVWHAGCSTGEEAYSMAILLHETGLYHKTRIYATDMNEGVLKYAKEGMFPLHKMRDYTTNYLKSGGTSAFSEYYTVKGENVIFTPYLGENIVFAQHNLVTDHSFNEFHVIICRNVMIYFDKVLQNRVHGLFYDSLAEQGILALGSKEGLTGTSYTRKYEELDRGEKIYRKLP